MAAASVQRWGVRRQATVGAAWRRAWLTAWLLVAVVGSARAQENLFTTSASPQTHGGQSFLGIDQIDPLSGSLGLRATDLALPGNAGLDLRVSRYYNSRIHPGFSDRDYRLEERSWVGVGWRLHFGRVIHPDSAIDGQTIVELSDGSRHPLYTAATGWISRSFLRYDKTTHILTAPNGLVYTFGHLAQSNGLLGAVRYVTEIRDLFNNTLTFTYFDAPGPTDGIAQIQQHLGNGQTRTVTFTYDPSTNLLSTMTYAGRVWTYGYAASTVAGHYLLTSVSPPRVAGAAERAWLYGYGTSVPGPELDHITLPTGGQVAYTYTTFTQQASATTYRARVVTLRTTLDPVTTATATWRFSYQRGTTMSETQISPPGAWNPPATPTNLHAQVNGTPGTTTVRYAVTAFTATGESAKTADVVVSNAPDVPDANNYVRLTWNAVPGATGYIVYGRSSTATYLDQSGGGGVGATAYHDNDDDHEKKGSPITTATHVAYRFNGAGTAGSFNAYLAGTLAKRTVVSNGQTVEQETFTYGPSEPLASVRVGTGPWSDDALYSPLLLSRSLTRDVGLAGETTWTTSYGYDPGNYNNYGQPSHIFNPPDAPAGRSVERAFKTDFTAYLGARPESETTTYHAAGGGGTSQRWVGYDSATGFVNTLTVDGVTTTFQPTPQGNVGSATDARGKTSTYSYAWGVLKDVQTPLQATTAAINSDGAPLWRDTAGLTTNYEYDAIGRPSRIVPPGGTAAPPLSDPTVFEYDETASLWSRVRRGDGASATVSTTYTDGFGRPIRTEDGNGVKTSLTYDNQGRTIFTSDSYTGSAVPARGTWITYDDLNRVRTVIVGSNVPGDADYSLTSYTYQGADVTVTDPKGGTTSYHNVLLNGPGDGRLAWVRDAANKVTRYEYRLLNTLTKVQGPGDPSADYTSVSGPQRTWTYDPSTNRLLEQNHPESGRTRYTQYDAVGHALEIRRTIAGQTDEVTQYTYDDNGRLTHEATVGTPFFKNLDFDAAGRLWRVTGEAVTTTYGFDAVSGRLTSRTDLLGGQSYASQVEYDSRDRVAALVYPSPSARRVTYQYDRQGRPQAVLNNGASFASGFHYEDATGRLDSFVTGAVTHHVTYDKQNRPTHLWTTGLLQAPNLDLGFAYDRAGNVTSVSDSQAGAQTFGYDALHRLTTASGPWGETSWVYDATGNRTREVHDDITTTYHYDAATNRLTSLTGGASEAFAYDGIGRLVSDSRGSYTYTPSGGLATATGAGMTATYTYDAAGGRVQRTVNGRTALTIRGVDGQVLSEFGEECGSLVWRRDLIYGAGRLLGAAKNATAVPTVGFASASGAIGEASGPAHIPVRLASAAPLGCPVSVSYATADRSATGGQDYGAASGTLTFPAGSLNGADLMVVIPIDDDALYEGPETFAVHLANPVGASLGSVSAKDVTIVDDDPMPAVSIGDTSVVEGHAGPVSANLAVTLSAVSARPVTVSYATTNGTAVAGSDYTAVSGSVTIPPGAATQTIAIQVTGDLVWEGNESLTVTLSAPANATIADGQGVVTILDDDDCQTAPTPGMVCPDGSRFAGYSPDGNVRMFTTPADAGTFRFAWPEALAHGYTNWTTGKANTAALAQYSDSVAPTHCAALVAHGRDDWYLPGPHEMNVLRGNATAIGGFDLTATTMYWTAAEMAETTGAYYHRMDGVTGYTGKGTALPIRCVRREMNATEFAFVDQASVPLSTNVASNILRVTGLQAATPVSLTDGGAYRVCPDATCSTDPPFTAGPASIASGQYLQLLQASSDDFATTVSTTVTVGTLSDTWQVTTAAQDVTPDAFTFVDQVGVALATVIDSNILQVTGITGNVVTSVSAGGAYRVCPDATCSTNPSFITTNGFVANGQYLQLRVTSSAADGMPVSATLTVGTLTDTWTVTTLGDGCAGTPAPGTVCLDGTVFAGYSPDGNVRMYTTVSDAGTMRFEWPVSDGHGYTNPTTGEANTLGMAQYSGYVAPTYCANLVAYGKSDWYLPGPYEMSVVRQNGVAIGGLDLTPTAQYWVAREKDGMSAAYFHYMDGTNGRTGKGALLHVRCVRKD